MPDLQSGIYPTVADSLQDESESIFENKSGLAEDLKFLASMPELCDITFLVGETREPVCAVKVSEERPWHISPEDIKQLFSLSLSSQAILAARSRIFYKMLYQQQASPQRKNPQPPPVRENKLRLFLKRSSEPLLNLQSESQKVIASTSAPRHIHNSRALFLACRSPLSFIVAYIHNERKT